MADNNDLAQGTRTSFRHHTIVSLDAYCTCDDGNELLRKNMQRLREFTLPEIVAVSGFWGQEAGWDACHEISAESGEGVEEVFRVVTRKLVEQNRKIQQALLQAMATPGIPGFGAGEAGYFDGAVYGGAGSAGGSFRVGRDRRSWLFSPGFTVPGVPVEVAEEREEMDGTVGRRKRCC
ncbi:hypothetical protein BN1723_003298 [Verticillium longisporum]|uniref:Uncharacterized protein n=1 Tax=Verticillium longisporum TaxID=100787 RepID=A0A0G4LTL0_VERLO|nr:hypothetical protein BN1723_003298 [Verticillium longisporum]